MPDKGDPAPGLPARGFLARGEHWRGRFAQGAAYVNLPLHVLPVMATKSTAGQEYCFH